MYSRVEIIVKSLGLAEESRTLAVPGEKGKASEEAEEEEDLNREEAKGYRKLVARGVYLSQARGDISWPGVTSASRSKNWRDQWRSLLRKTSGT